MAGMRGAMLSRRRLLASAWGAGALTVLGGVARPYLSRAADRPQHHARHSVRRYLARRRHRVGARRPAGAHDGRGGDDRELQGHHPRRPRSMRCRRAISPRRSLLENLPAGQDIFYRVRFARHRLADDRAASRRSAASAPRRTTSVECRSCGPAIPRRLGHRRGARRHAHLRDDAAQPAGLLRPLRRQHLRRVPAGRASRSSRTARSGATSSRRRSRASPRRSPTIAATTNTICSTAICAPSTPRSRCSRNGTTTRSPTTGGPACRCASATPTSRRWRRAAAGLPRVHADAAVRGRARAHLSQDRLRAAARRVHARHAQLSRAERRRQAGDVWPGRAFPRAGAGGVAQARAGRVARDLEGDRGRPADRR